MDYDYADKINKPKWQPSAIVFKIVWPILYILMFVSLYIFLKTENNFVKTLGVSLFLIQLFLNFSWVPIFFYYKKIGFAFCISVILTIFVWLMLGCFYSVSTLAGLLNLPYLLWMVFADFLNYEIWIRNKDILP